MIKLCGCENCKDRKVCNGVDLMNCYAKKKLTIKPPKEQKMIKKDCQNLWRAYDGSIQCTTHKFPYWDNDCKGCVNYFPRTHKASK